MSQLENHLILSTAAGESGGKSVRACIHIGRRARKLKDVGYMTGSDFDFLHGSALAGNCQAISGNGESKALLRAVVAIMPSGPHFSAVIRKLLPGVVIDELQPESAPIDRQDIQHVSSATRRKISVALGAVALIPLRIEIDHRDL